MNQTEDLKLFELLFQTGSETMLSILDMEESLLVANDMLVIHAADEYGDELPSELRPDFIAQFVDLFQISLLSLFDKKATERTGYNLELRTAINTVHNVLTNYQTDVPSLHIDVSSNRTIFSELAEEMKELWAATTPLEDPILRQQAKIVLAKSAPSFKYQYDSNIDELSGNIQHQVKHLLDAAISSTVS